jgi:hypothetical protein
MLPIIPTLSGRSFIHASAKAKTASPSNMVPRLANRPSRPHPLPSLYIPRTNYYFAANQQTALTFKSLLNQLDDTPDTAVTLHQISLAMQNLLQSIRPKFSSAENKQADFDTLLKSHLDTLDASALTKLAQALRQAKFHFTVTDSVLRNTAPNSISCSSDKQQIPSQKQTVTLLDTAMLYARLDELIIARQMTTDETTARNFPTSEQIQSARNLLAECSLSWQHHTQPENINKNLLEAAQKFSAIFNLPKSPDRVISMDLPTRHALVNATDRTLFVDTALINKQPDTTLITKVLRDVLELTLMKKIFGQDAALATLVPAQLAVLRNHIDAVISLTPSIEIPAQLHDCANRVMAGADTFGKVQIIPASGSKLGHAWIAPHLSIVPNRNQAGNGNAGQSFLQSGSATAPKSTTMRQWPAKFLNATENEKLYPADETLQLTVPVHAEKLQASALQTKTLWTDHALPYLFMGTAPDIHPSGCRVTVWHAVIQGMDEDTQALFTYFNRGLPDPDSPTELWQRLDGLMRWIRQLANSSAASNSN